MFEFKSCQELIERVEKTLESFGASGFLDQGDFYRQIKEVLINLNIPACNEKELVIKIDGNSFPKPDDMRTVWAIWPLSYQKAVDETYTLSKRRFEFFSEMSVNRYEVNNCGDESIYDNELLSEGNMITITEKVKETAIASIDFKTHVPLKIISKNTNICLYNNEISNHEDSCYYSNGKFTFNFSDAWLMFQYFAFEKDFDGLPMIPDEIKIEQAIESYLIYKFMLKAYYNNEADVQQRLQYSEMQYRNDFQAASRFVNTPTFKSMMNYALRKKNKWNKFNLV